MKSPHQKRPKIKAGQIKAHLKFIRRLPCVICGAEAEAAHVRYSDAAWHKVNPGMGSKDDRWVVPLCADHHRNGQEAQHRSNERVWWESYGIDPLPMAAALWDCSGDIEAGLRVLRDHKPERKLDVDK